MKIFIFLFFCATTVSAQTDEKLIAPVSLNWYLPSLQFRFEDGPDQSRLLKTGYALRVGTEFYKNYFLGLSYSTQTEKSGNSSLSIKREFSEIDIAAGFQFLRFDFTMKNRLNILGLGYFGRNQNIIKTELLGRVSTDLSAGEFSYGGGVMAQFIVNYFLFEIETRAMTSGAYEPRIVSVTDLRLGFQIHL